MAELTEPDAPRCLGRPGSVHVVADPVVKAAERRTWDGLVREHAAELWASALARGLSRNDATEVCELVWRNAAQRLHLLGTPGEVRAYLMDSVNREAHRMSRLRALQSGSTRIDSGENVIRLDEWIPLARVTSACGR